MQEKLEKLFSGQNRLEAPPRKSSHFTWKWNWVSPTLFFHGSTFFTLYFMDPSSYMNGRMKSHWIFLLPYLHCLFVCFIGPISKNLTATEYNEWHNPYLASPKHKLIEIRISSMKLLPLALAKYKWGDRYEVGVVGNKGE